MNRLLSYYQKELNFLKQHGKIFASRYPKIARRLGIVEGETEDPHISRLIESFALLTSRIHQRLDDDMPELVNDLLAILAPQFIKPLPSICIVMVEPDPIHSGLTGKNTLATDTALFFRHSTPVPYQFQTVYPVTLLPIYLKDALLHYDSDALNWYLKLSFQVWSGATINNDTIRIYLNGPDNAVNTIYTFLCSETKSLILNQEGKSSLLSPTDIKPVGFSKKESLLIKEPKISPVHNLLMDYFWFPQKFHFIDIQLPSDFCVKNNGLFEIKFIFHNNQLTESLGKITELINSDFFRLHCTPAINLFSLRAEPFILEDSKAEYPVIPDTRHQSQLEVWSVQKVSIQRKINNSVQQFDIMPLLERHTDNSADESPGLYWKSFCRENLMPKGLEHKQYIAFSEQPNREVSSAPEVVTINALCTNQYLPSKTQYFGNPDGDFDTDAPVASLKITALTHPTPPVEPASKNSVRWRFLSQLSLSHQLLNGDEGVKKLKEILTLYNFNNRSSNSHLVSLIQSLDYQPITARLISNDPHSLARGIDLIITFKHDAIKEPEYYMLCCLLDHLFALYAPVNSFTRLTTCIAHEDQTRRVWPIRAARISWL